MQMPEPQMHMLVTLLATKRNNAPIELAKGSLPKWVESLPFVNEQSRAYLV